MSKADGVRGVVKAELGAEEAELGAEVAELAGPLLDGIVGSAAAAVRRRGRPPGARNRKTVEMIEYLEKRYLSPLEGLAKTWSASTWELAIELGCSLEEAFDKQQAARIAALPFWHQRLSPDVAVNVAGFTTLQFITGPHLGAGGPGEGGDEAALAAAVESVRNQQVSDDGGDDV